MRPDGILAIDVGGGTQDVLLYEAGRPIDGALKLVLPAQTQVVARRIERATQQGRPIFLDGWLMGGGASGNAIKAHLAAGLNVYAKAGPARIVHNDLERVQELGIVVTDDPPNDAVRIWCSDVDLDALRQSLAHFEIALPDRLAIAVQDHGYVPGRRGRSYRSEYLRSLLERDGDAANMVYADPPEPMIRMRSVAKQFPGATIMDTGAAAVLGILGDPVVAERAGTSGAVLINIGNLHTFAIAFRQRRIFGLFEHHTGGVTPDWLSGLVDKLRSGTLTHEEVMRHGGHGAAFRKDFKEAGEFPFVAVTGPNRHIARDLGYYQAAPYGDMMLSGSFGLVHAVLGTFGGIYQAAA